MIELKLYVSDVDYESVVQALSGKLAGPAVLAAKALPDGAKEEMAVRYINGSASKLEEMMENALASKGVKLKITGAQASIIHGK